MRFEAGLIKLRQLVRGFLFVPALISLAGVALAVITVSIDRSGLSEPIFNLLGILTIDIDGARSVLSTIAGAMMTVISLVYSLTLIVFTLAASNIGPRVLETFTENRINQITVGLLGATFLFALIVLYLAGEDEVPTLSVGMAILLAAISFFWLIYFVHDTAQRVMVDNEVARTQRALRHAINRLIDKEPAQPVDHQFIPAGDPVNILSPRSGYIAFIDEQQLIKLAETHDGFIELTAQPGDFIIRESCVARLYGGLHELPVKRFHPAIMIHDARTPEGDIQFNVHLNVEIALRALSPGANDSYTAISVIDHLSSSLSIILKNGMPPPIRNGASGQPRLKRAQMSTADLTETALAPLRQAARGDIFVTLKLIAAIARMIAATGSAGPLRRHLLAIARDARMTVINPMDRNDLAKALRAARTGKIGLNHL